MRYTVKRIDEDLDFGCEEHVEGAPVMAVVTLVDACGQESKLRHPDQLLYDRDINRGDLVVLNANHELEKIGGEKLEPIDIYGTIGPACATIETLTAMFREGMTGIRLNTSHVSLREAAESVQMIRQAAESCGVQPKLLIDMQGPELRVGKMDREMPLVEGEHVRPGVDFPVPPIVKENLKPGLEILLDDGKLLIQMIDGCEAEVLRGGILKSGKSIAPIGSELRPPTMTPQDLANIADAAHFGVTGVMQPFVRDAEDLRVVREALDAVGGKDIQLLAKIENMSGVKNLESFFGIADEIVIARGDLGNAMPLWELPRVQKEISEKCRKAKVPFMVVTQMLASMEHCAVPTRAEVSDIYNAVCDGASSVMVTGETAVGEYPVDVIRYLVKTVSAKKGHHTDV